MFMDGIQQKVMNGLYVIRSDQFKTDIHQLDDGVKIFYRFVEYLCANGLLSVSEGKFLVLEDEDSRSGSGITGHCGELLHDLVEKLESEGGEEVAGRFGAALEQVLIRRKGVERQYGELDANEKGYLEALQQQRSIALNKARSIALADLMERNQAGLRGIVSWENCAVCRTVDGEDLLVVGDQYFSDGTVEITPPASMIVGEYVPQEITFHYSEMFEVRGYGKIIPRDGILDVESDDPGMRDQIRHFIDLIGIQSTERGGAPGSSALDVEVIANAGSARRRNTRRGKTPKVGEEVSAERRQRGERILAAGRARVAEEARLQPKRAREGDRGSMWPPGPGEKGGVRPEYLSLDDERSPARPEPLVPAQGQPQETAPTRRSASANPSPFPTGWELDKRRDDAALDSTKLIPFESKPVPAEVPTHDLPLPYRTAADLRQKGGGLHGPVLERWRLQAQAVDRQSRRILSSVRENQPVYFGYHPGTQIALVGEENPFYADWMNDFTGNHIDMLLHGKITVRKRGLLGRGRIEVAMPSNSSEGNDSGLTRKVVRKLTRMEITETIS
ncbi:hypothetical protein [Streptomyces sp. NPDC047981]|uniref:hypothetical protein n=1 Tax=Streptomyces sp. NPDC047981 TaxID=3154610 RepID=UPI0034200A68